MLKYLLIILLILFGFVNADKIMEMPELLNPTSMVMDTQGIYIADGPSVKIYSLEKSKFVNKIGKKGDGPGEFRVAPNLPITINLYNDNLYVCSLGKISIYTREGVFIKEIRNQTMAINLIPCSNIFLGKGFAQSEGKLYFTVNIYNEQLKKIKEIYREASERRRGINQKFDPIDATGPAIAAHSNLLLLNNGNNRNTITVYNLEGKELYSITHKFREIKLTKEHIKRYMDYLETDPNFRDFVARTKHLFKFKDLFPLIQYFIIDDNKIFVTSYENTNGMRDLYMFTLKGQFLKHMEVPLVSENVDNPYPLTFHMGKLYQIVENIDEQSWELLQHHIDVLKP